MLTVVLCVLKWLFPWIHWATVDSSLTVGSESIWVVLCVCEFLQQKKNSLFPHWWAILIRLLLERYLHSAHTLHTKSVKIKQKEKKGNKVKTEVLISHCRLVCKYSHVCSIVTCYVLIHRNKKTCCSDKILCWSIFSDSFILCVFPYFHMINSVRQPLRHTPQFTVSE